MKYKKDEIVTVKIEDIGNDGSGIGKDNGFTIFIKDTVIGDLVTARIMKVKTNFAYAKLEKVETPSLFRVTPKCAISCQCGGCQLQVLDYKAQLEYKQSKVRNNLIRIGGFTSNQIDTVLEPMIGMENEFRYRNKAQYPFGYDKAGNLVTGFYAGRTHDIIANTDCLLGDERNQEILEALIFYMKANHIAAYCEKSGSGFVRHVLIRSGFYTGEMMVCLVVCAKKKFDLPKQQDLIDALVKIPGMTGIFINLNPDKTNVIMGKKGYRIWGEERIHDKLGDLTFQISPLSFFQINTHQAEKLYHLALEYANLTGHETVWDLYCGIGTISLYMARKAKQVFGIEIVPEAVQDARINAEMNRIKNAQFFVGKAEEILPKKYGKENIHADIVIIDPPRKGCDIDCLETIIKMKPNRIVYVSCDSATLARDLRILCEKGYVLTRVRPVDQFGQTIHVESVALLVIDISS